ncbi:SRPBCC family protein [Arthrobacter sp. EH-1B-1]|uniref:SRPBCC family protein n=1 Tax=Arthrobacter vasquezii TaxID=2977629 RepID=A0ABT6CTK1_9MICC|nr:SRPBCC family protein [Arthrobacter vasquezii]
MIDVVASIDLAVPPREVWAVIKPPETATLLDPNLIRAFRVPGTPKGVGEMQGFIGHRDGREYAQLVEVVEEVAERWVLIRVVGGPDEAARTGYRLTAIPEGTRLEQLLSVTVPASQIKARNQIRQQYRAAAEAFLERVRVLVAPAGPSSGRHT